MSFVELDHCSSGIQICSALTRDSRLVKEVGLIATDAKGDLYSKIARKANKEIKKAGISLKPLARKDVKTSVIAKIYGASHLAVYEGLEAETGVSASDSNGAWKIAHQVIADELGAVVAVEQYIQSIVKAVAEAGHKSVTITIPGGVRYTVDFVCGEKSVAPFTVNYFKGKQHHSAKARGLKVPTEENVKAAGRQLAAGFVQGCDALILARVQVMLAEAGIPFLAKHDAYIIDDQHQDALREIVSRAFYEIFKVDHLKLLHEDVTERYGEIVEPFDGYGSYAIEDVLSAKFLIA